MRASVTVRADSLLHISLLSLRYIGLQCFIVCVISNPSLYCHLTIGRCSQVIEGRQSLLGYGGLVSENIFVEPISLIENLHNQR